MTELNLALHTTDSGYVLEATGELDNCSAPQVRDVLMDLRLDPGQQLVVDLSGVTFCDSSGITVLIASRNHALAAGAGIALAAVPERITRIFRIVGLEQVFAVYPTTRAAADDWALAEHRPVVRESPESVPPAP